MRQFTVSLMVLVAMTLSPVMGQNATEQRVEVKTVVGKVELRSGGSGKWREARIGMPVKMGWDVRTYVESNIELKFESGTELRIGENSVVTLSNLLVDQGGSQSGVKVATGQIWANVKKLTNQKSKFEFETPTAVASIRGTRLGINVDKSGMALDVYEGLVMIKPRGSDKETPVATATRAVLALGSSDVKIMQMSSKDGRDSLAQKFKDPFAPATDTGKALADSLKPATGVADSLKKTPPPDSLKPPVPADSLKKPALPDTLKPGIPGKTDSLKTVPPASIDTSAKNRPGTPDTTKAVRPPLPDTTKVPVRPTRTDTTAAAPPPPVQTILVLAVSSPAQNAILTEKSVTIKGTVTKGATLSVGGKDVAIAPDGTFSTTINATPGKNTVSLDAKLADKSKSMDVSFEYHPKLVLNVSNLVNNMEVTTPDLAFTVTVSEGATFFVNGVEGDARVTLNSGRNTITVRATDPWGGVQERSFIVTLRETQTLFVRLTAPANGSTINKPLIPVSGTTVPGAEVTVNNTTVQVNTGGIFSYTIPIPDEAQDYTVTVTARYNGKEVTEERSVTYTPAREPLTLTVTFPTEGMAIRQSILRVIGKTSAGAQIMVNTKPATVSALGIFSYDLRYIERDIGLQQVSIVASNEEKEMEKTVNVMVDVTSSQINISAPIVVVTGAGQRATRTGKLLIQVADQTPDDQIVLTIQDNNDRDEEALDPGARKEYTLAEGKNDFTVRAKDKALNPSNVVSGSIYYLPPGQLTINVVEPSQLVQSISDLPPMPRNVSIPKMRVRVEIDDGINGIPETIKYVKIVSSSETVLLRNNNNYTYTGDISLRRGVNAYTITTEDDAGNTAIQTLSITINE